VSAVGVSLKPLPSRLGTGNNLPTVSETTGNPGDVFLIPSNLFDPVVIFNSIKLS
jgi:hypothetical protein